MGQIIYFFIFNYFLNSLGITKVTTIKSEGNINVCIKFHSNNQKYQPGGGAGGKVGITIHRAAALAWLQI